MKKFSNLKDAISYSLSYTREYSCGYEVYQPPITYKGIFYAGGIQELDNNYYVTDSRDYQFCIYTNESS